MGSGPRFCVAITAADYGRFLFNPDPGEREQSEVRGKRVESREEARIQTSRPGSNSHHLCRFFDRIQPPERGRAVRECRLSCAL